MFARARNKKELKRNEKIAIKELKEVFTKEEMKYFLSVKDEPEVSFDKEDKEGKKMYFNVTEKLEEWMISKMNRGTLYFYIITPMELSVVVGFGYDSVFSSLKNEKGKHGLYLVGCGASIQALDELIKVDLNAIKRLREFGGTKEKLKDYIMQIGQNLEEDDEHYKEDSFLEIVDSAINKIDDFFDDDKIVVSKFKLNLDGTIEPVSDISCEAHRRNYELVKLNHNIEKDSINTNLSFVVKEIRQKFQLALYQQTNTEELEEHIEKIDDENILQEVLLEMIMTENDKTSWNKEAINLLYYQFFGLDRTMYKILNENNCTKKDIEKYLNSNFDKLSDSLKVIKSNNFEDYPTSQDVLSRRNAMMTAFRKMCNPNVFMNKDTLDGKNLIKNFLITVISGALTPINTILNVFEWEIHQKKNNVFKMLNYSDLEDKEGIIDALSEKFGDNELKGGRLN